jgi:hypothetical protein
MPINMKLLNQLLDLKNLRLWALLALPIITSAHQPEITSTMLVENEKGEWILRITCSASALEYEVKKTFGEDSYKTKAEFEKLALTLIKNNVSLSANENETLSLNSETIKIGHESQILFKVANMPKELNSITVRNSSFEDIHHHQGALIVLKNGFQKKQFLLTNENDHTLKLTSDSGKWIVTENSSLDFNFLLKLIGISFAILLIAFISTKSYKKRISPIALKSIN